jgi:chorismate-pyruvate lyase
MTGRGRAKIEPWVAGVTLSPFRSIATSGRDLALTALETDPDRP